jgi:hypothetical protein
MNQTAFGIPDEWGTGGLPEIQGTAPGGDLWALVFHPLPLPLNTRVKIVWRMTGSGELQLVAVGPDGQHVSPVGITYHLWSVWKRPGEEWGSAFTFPTSGNWRIHANRGNLSGDVQLFIQ